MAGVKGRSGGARPGAGRPPKEPKTDSSEVLQTTTDPADWLTALMVNPSIDITDRKDAAKALLAALGKKAGGKKGARVAAAEEVAKTGRFAPGAAPKLKVVGGRA